MLTTAITGALVFSLLGSEPQDPEPSPSFVDVARSTTQVSANQAFAIRLERDAEGRCRVLGLRETQSVWEVQRCLGTVDDVLLISNQGDKFWVMHTLPNTPPEAPPSKKKPRKKNSPSHPPLWDVVVAQEFDRTGQVLQSRRVSDLVVAYDRAKVQLMGKHFKWLEGVSGMTGRAPRVTPGNQVEFEVVGGKTMTLSF